MRSQALLRKSRSLLRNSAFISRPSPCLSRIRVASRAPKSSQVIGKRLATTTSYNDSDAPSSTLPATPIEPPEDGDPSTTAEANAEPERKTRKARMSAQKDVDLPTLPEDLDVLWSPYAEPIPEGPLRTSLPPPGVFQEALHSLNIALHPQVQHKATFAMPGGLKEPTLSLYCPLEGGEYVIDETVRELARRVGADVVVVDAAHLAAGEWGHFGPAAKSLKLARNPLHFTQNIPSSHRPPLEDDEEPEFVSSMSGPTRVALAVLTPSSGFQGQGINLTAARRSSSPGQLKLFFDTLVNLPASHTGSETNTRRPRLIYVRDFPTLAPYAHAWYPALLAAVRQRRRGPLSRPSAPVPFPMAIIFGSTPSLALDSNDPASSRHNSPLNMIMRRTPASPASGRRNESGEDEVSQKARESRLRDRLHKWGTGEWQDDVPTLRMTADEVEVPRPGPEVIVLGNPEGPDWRGPFADAQTSDPHANNFFRSTFVVPEARSLEDEKQCRMKRRRELNELAMRMGIGAVGGRLEQRPQRASNSEPSDGFTFIPDSQEQMWDSWGNELEAWSEVRQIADRALGTKIHGTIDHSSLDPTTVDWPTLYTAWADHRSQSYLRKSWMDSSMSTSAPGVQDSSESTNTDIPDEVIERVRRNPDLDQHEKRLLPCIVDPRLMQTSFAQVHLPAHTVDSVRTIVSLPLLHPSSFQHGILKEHAMTGCLLFGPPGTGKTLLVKALAKEAGCRMLSISPSDVMDMYVGEGEKLVKAVFSLARQLSPCVIFLDEIDALFGARTSSRENGGAIAHRGIITEFMQEMDGLKSSKDDSIIVVGATNRPFDLDDAVLRRLPRRLLVDLPGELEREAILRIMLRDEQLDPDVDIRHLAQQTASFSGSDLKHLCVSAALDAVKERVHVPWSTTSKPATTPDTASGSEQPKTHRTLRAHNFTKALKEITPSSSDGVNAAVRKWNEEYGEGRAERKRLQVWGKGLFGFVEKKPAEAPSPALVPSAPETTATNKGQ